MATLVKIIIHLEIKPSSGGSPPRERRINKKLKAPRDSLLLKEPNIFMLVASRAQRLINIQNEILT